MFFPDFLCMTEACSKTFCVCFFIFYEGFLNLALIEGNFYLTIHGLTFPLLENELTWAGRHLHFFRGLRSSFGFA